MCVCVSRSVSILFTGALTHSTGKIKRISSRSIRRSSTVNESEKSAIVSATVADFPRPRIDLESWEITRKSLRPASRKINDDGVTCSRGLEKLNTSGWKERTSIDSSKTVPPDLI